MARTDAISIFESDGSTEVKLRELYAEYIDMVDKLSIANQIKNPTYSGNPLAGSVEFRRPLRSTIRAYGTARTAGKGDEVNADIVTVNLDQRKEQVEEANAFDIEQWGFDGLWRQRMNTMALDLALELDEKLFDEIESEATSVTVTGTEIVDKIEELIVSVETIKNDYVRSVARQNMALCLHPTLYSEMRNYIDTLPNPAGGGVVVDTFHGVRVFSNNSQTANKAICLVTGSIAQPVAVKDVQYGKIQFSVEEALGLFFNYGTKAIASDLMKYATIGSLPSV
jgi:hypothetical protein